MALSFVNVLLWGISLYCMFQTNVTKTLFSVEVFTARGLRHSLIKAHWTAELKHLHLKVSGTYMNESLVCDIAVDLIYGMHYNV